jgi:enoyl-CoA hydratase/carnithine racemase
MKLPRVHQAAARTSALTGRRALCTHSFDDIELFVGKSETARIKLNRPDKRNALSTHTMKEMLHALDIIAASSARVVVLESSGSVFCAGHDLSELRGTDSSQHVELFDKCRDLMQRLNSIPQPIIAKVDGLATAAGCQLVASCDLAIASTRSAFATPGVSIGLFCSTPMVPLSRAVGPKRAMQMLLTGEHIPAAVMLQWGMLNDVVLPEKLCAAAQHLANRICEASPLTVRTGKAAFWAQEGLSQDKAYDVTVPAMVRNASARDAQEGFSAFFEKRAPKWIGE